METGPRKALPVVLVLALLVMFGSGVFLGVKLAPRLAWAATPEVADGQMQMKADGGCGMQMQSEGCPMMKAGKGTSDAAPQAQGGCSMGSPKPGAAAQDQKPASGGCPMMKSGSAPTSAATGPAQEKTDTGKGAYICTMCPEVKADGPGSCPKCGMALVKKQ